MDDLSNSGINLSLVTNRGKNVKLLNCKNSHFLVSLNEKVITELPLPPSTVCFQKVLQLINRLCISFLAISLWSEKQHFKLDVSSSFRSLRRFLGLCIKGCQLGSFKPIYWRPMQELRLLGAHPGLNCLRPNCRRGKCIFQRYGHDDNPSSCESWVWESFSGH